MPFPVAIIVIAAVASAIGGVGYGADQHDQRVREKRKAKSVRKEIRRLEDRIADQERTHAALKASLGAKNQQVRDLAAEIVVLRAQLKYRRSA